MVGARGWGRLGRDFEFQGLVLRFSMHRMDLAGEESILRETQGVLSSPLRLGFLCRGQLYSLLKMTYYT